VTVQLLDYDAKRIHLFEQIKHATEGWVSATSENMTLSVDMTAKKVAPFHDSVLRLSLIHIFGRPGEADAVAADREMAAQLHLGKAGRAKLEAIQIPALGVGADVAAQIRDAIAAERDLIDADADLDRNGWAEGAAGQFLSLIHI